MDLLELMLQDGALCLDTDKSRIEKFIMSFYHPDGGFTKGTGKPDIFNTALALKTLRMLYQLQDLDLKKVEAFINSCKCPDGGFSDQPGKPHGDLKSTFMAASILNSFRFEYDLQATREFTLGMLEGDGAFADGPGIRKTSANNSYLGTFGLAHLGHEFTDFEKERVLKYVHSLQGKDGGFKRSDGSKLSSAVATAQAMMVIYYFDPEHDPGEDIEYYLQSLYRPEGGHVAFAGAVNSDLSSTFHALILQHLLGLATEDATKVFVLSCQHPSGGFVNIVSDPEPSIESTYHGVGCLCLLADRR